MKQRTEAQYPGWQKWFMLGIALIAVFVEPLVNWVIQILGG